VLSDIVDQSNILREAIMPKQLTKELLLYKGAEIMHHKGFQSSGIEEVLETTGVPKGSFYYYFKSKEDFGLQVIDLYAGVMFQTLRTNMDVTGEPIVERLRGFFSEMTDHAVKSGYSGCPIGNISQEMGGVNEVFRQKLNEIFGRLEQEVTGHLKAAQTGGEISRHILPEQAAVFLISSWEGVLLRMKLMKETSPFDIFERTVFNDLLGR
jgi:TetR/AcrR family transcriptional repressor of nem operon